MRISALILTSLLLASSVPAAETPRPAPELIIQRFQTAPLLLRQLRGKVVAVAFEEGVTNNFPMYLKAFEPNFAAGITNEAQVKKFVQWNDKRDGILMVPYMLFIDARGIIRGDHDEDGFFGASDKNIRAQLDKMLQPAAKKKELSRR